MPKASTSPENESWSISRKTGLEVQQKGRTRRWSERASAEALCRAIVTQVRFCRVYAFYRREKHVSYRSTMLRYPALRSAQKATLLSPAGLRRSVRKGGYVRRRKWSLRELKLERSTASRGTDTSSRNGHPTHPTVHVAQNSHWTASVRARAQQHCT